MECLMLKRNHLIIFFTVLYLFIEIGFRAVVNELLKAPIVSQDVTDMFVVLGRLVSAIGFTVILFGWLKNHPYVSKHPKKSIAGLYLSSFVVISVITSLALTWLPLNTQIRAFYASYYKSSAYFEHAEKYGNTAEVSETKFTTLPLLMISEPSLATVQNTAEPLIAKTIDNLVYNNRSYYLTSLSKVEHAFSNLWVQYQRANYYLQQEMIGEELDKGAFGIQMLYRKYARDAFINYRINVMRAFYADRLLHVESYNETSFEYHRDENWKTETYNQTGKVIWNPSVNKTIVPGGKRRDDVEKLHNIENNFKKEPHGFNTIESSTEYYKLLELHERYFQLQLSFDKRATVDNEYASKLLEYAKSRCQEFKLGDISLEQKALLNQHISPAVYTVTSSQGKTEVSFIPIDYEGFKQNVTICDYRNIETHMRKLYVDIANKENAIRGFNHDINLLSEFKKTPYAKKEITKQLEKKLDLNLATIKKADKAYFEYVYKAVLTKKVQTALSKEAATAKLSCKKKCGEIIPLGLDRVSLLSLPVFREKIQPEYPDMFDTNDRFISATESTESRNQSLLRISNKQKNEAQKILALIHNNQVTKTDLSPYTKATLGPILLMLFANIAIFLNIASLLLTILKVKRVSVAILVTLMMLSLPFAAEKYGSHSAFNVGTSHGTTTTWLLGANRVLSSIPLVESVAKRTTMHLLHWHLQFFRDNVGKNELRGKLYQQLK